MWHGYHQRLMCRASHYFVSLPQSVKWGWRLLPTGMSWRTATVQSSEYETCYDIFCLDGKNPVIFKSFAPHSQRSLYKAGWLLPQALTDGIVSQQDQFFLQSESPDVETVARLSCTFHPHQNVSKVTRNVSVSVHRHTAAAHHASTRAWSNGQAFSINNLAQSHQILHFNFMDVMDGGVNTIR